MKQLTNQQRIARLQSTRAALLNEMEMAEFEGNPIDLTRSINAIDQRIAEINQGTAPELNN